jgi:hypothetical protein
MFDPDFPLEYTEGPAAEVETSIFEPSFKDTQRTFVGGPNMKTIISGNDTYARKLEKINNLLDPMDQAYGRAVLVAKEFYNMSQETINRTLETIQLFKQIQYLNMIALLGAIKYYNTYNLSDKNKIIKQTELEEFYKKNQKIQPEITIEDLHRYIRLSIKTLRKS